MRQKKPLIAAHLESWNNLKKLLSELGKEPYINFSDESIEIPLEIPKTLLPPESPSSKAIDYEILSLCYPSTVRSDGILVTRPIGELRNSGTTFKKPPVELRYYIPGTSVPPKARKKYHKNRLIQDVVKANIENCFREINPKFYSFFEYFRSYHFTPVKSREDGTVRILSKFLEPYWDSVLEPGLGGVLSPYVNGILDYFSSKVNPEYLTKKKKDILTEVFEHWTDQMGIKYLMKEPFEILRDTMWKQGDIDSERVILNIEDLYDLFSEKLKRVYKLEINGNWSWLL